jgi:YegS/Rv2252/BmrU family lipid kinase
MARKQRRARSWRSSNADRGTKRSARQRAAIERAEESRARLLDRRIGEAQALAPLAATKPDVANEPVVGLWPKRRALLIINSKSGPNQDSILHVRDLVDMLASFGIGADVRVKLRKSQTRKEVRAAAIRKRRPYALVIAAGGDGTVEAVASGLVGTRTTLGIIPLGTYNNIATCLGIPADVAQACALIASGTARQIDVGQVIARQMKRPRIFLEVSTVGLGATLGVLGQHVEKGRWDHATQALPGALDMSPTPTRVRLDDEVQGRTSNTLLVTVSNSPRAGAGLPLAPGARMDDGLLDVCIYEDMQQPAVLARFLPSPVGSPSGGSGAQDAGVLRARARTVEIETTRPMPVSIESKLVGVTPARFTVLTGALSVIAGDADALLHPSSTALVRASASAAHVLAPVPRERRNGDAPQQQVNQSSSGFLQVLVPAAGRALETVSSARSIAVPLLAGVLGVAAATALRPRAKGFFR